MRVGKPSLFLLLSCCDPLRKEPKVGFNESLGFLAHCTYSTSILSVMTALRKVTWRPAWSQDKCYLMDHNGMYCFKVVSERELHVIYIQGVIFSTIQLMVMKSKRIFVIILNKANLLSFLFVQLNWRLYFNKVSVPSQCPLETNYDVFCSLAWSVSLTGKTKLQNLC